MAGQHAVGSLLLTILFSVWRVECFEETNNPIFDDSVIFRRLSATLACEGTDFVPDEQVCYQISLVPDQDSITRYRCENVTIDQDNSRLLEFLPREGPGGTLTVTSPNFPDSYPGDYVCLYSIPPCRDGRDIYYVSWTKDNFVLDDAGDFFFLNDICVDLVELITPSDPDKLELGGARLEDPFQRKTLCGNQGNFRDTSGGGRGLFIRFRSSHDTHAQGFRMSIQCAPAEDWVTTLGNPRHTGYIPKINITKKWKDRVEVPAEAFITYQENTLSIVQINFVELLTFENITRFFFWTGFNGTRVFIRTAPVPLEEIFGGGTLLIVKNCAYYATFDVPPRFVPDDEQVTVINIILAASSVFFMNTTPPPPTLPPKPHKHHHHHYHYPQPTTPPEPQPTSPPDDLPFGFDLEAVRLACRFRTATNPFLRQTIADYFELLQVEDIFLFCTSIP